jgi:hypothetical protein
MEQQNIFTIITVLQQKLDALKTKIDLQKTLAASVLTDFDTIQHYIESLKADFDSSLNKLDSTSVKTDSTSVLIDSSSVKADSTSVLIDSSSVKTDSTSVLIDSSPVKDDSTSVLIDSSSVKTDSTSNKSGIANNKDSLYLEKLSRIIVVSAKEKLKIYYSQPNIPMRMAAILNELIEKKRMSVAEMKIVTGASRISLVRDIAILKKLGWLKFNGSRKNGFFTLTPIGEQTLEGLRVEKPLQGLL